MARKRRKKSAQTKMYEQCLDLCRDVVRARDGWICCKCGKQCKSNYDRHWSHIKGRGVDKRLAYDPKNSVIHCYQCHLWWHADIPGAYLWFKGYAPHRLAHIDRWHQINMAKGTITIGELETARDELRAKLLELVK